jgi:hypothetical protein
MGFSKYLSYLFELQLYRLVDLSKATGISSADLSNIVKGRRPCGAANLLKLTAGLQEDHRGLAVLYWTQDQIPEKLRNLVHVVRANNNVTESQLPPDAGTLEGALVILRAEAERNPAVFRVLTNLAVSFA